MEDVVDAEVQDVRPYASYVSTRISNTSNVAGTACGSSTQASGLIRPLGILRLSEVVLTLSNTVSHPLANR